MKRLLTLCASVSIALLGTSGIATASSSLGVVGQNGQVLSTTTTVAGSGSLGEKDETADAASFRMPSGLVVLPDGSVWISDSRSNLIRKLSKGKVTTQVGWIAGAGVDGKGAPNGTLIDDLGGAATFPEPQGMAVDADGNVYVADAANHAIRKITPAGKTSTIAGDGVQGNADGIGALARFHTPLDVAIADDGTLYVADTLNHVIRKIDPFGKVTTLNNPSDRVVEMIPGYVERAGDYRDGELRSAKFNEPTSIVLDKLGNLYVSDTGNQVIRYIDLKKQTVTTVAGDASLVYGRNALYKEGDYLNGDASAARFNAPKGLALTSEGGLVIADSLNHSVRYLYDGQVTTLAGGTSEEGLKDGVESNAKFRLPVDVAVDQNDNLWIADASNQALRYIDFYRYPQSLAANEALQIVAGQEIISFQHAPKLVEGHTLVNALEFVKALNVQATVTDREGVQTVKLVHQNQIVEMKLEKNTLTAYQSGEELYKMTLDKAITAADAVYVPLRQLAEALGFDVQWDAQSNAVIVRTQ